MSKAVKALLALTRHAAPAQGMRDLCSACLPADIRDELASLSHRQDLEELASRNADPRLGGK